MPGASALQKRTPVARPDDARYLTQAAGDARYQTGVLSPLYGFFAKESNALVQRCDVVMVGDSIMEGTGSPNVASRWVDLAQAKLRSRFTTGTQGPGYIPASYAASPSGGGTFPAWTYTGTTFNQGSGLGNKSKQLTAGSTATITRTCTSFKLFLTRTNTSDAVTISIDGAAATTFTLSNAVTSQTWTSPALTTGSHTIVVSQSVGQPHFCGGFFYNGDETAGLALWDGSHSGWRMQDFAATYTEWYNHLPFVAPSLMVLGCGTNDARTTSSGYSAAQYGTYCQSIITQARAKVPNLPILLLPPYSPVTVNFVEPWANYIAQLKSIAGSNAYCALFDMSARIPYLSPDPYSFLIDGIHPTALGHALMSTLATTALSPS